MSETSRIPIPLAQRWRTIRFQILPYFFFGACVVVTVALWNRHAGNPNAIGEVFAQRIDLTSTGDGILLEVPGQRLELFEPVRAGQVIARIDDGTVKGELALYKKQLEMFSADEKGTEEEMRLAQEDRLLKERQEKTRLQGMLNEAQIEFAKAHRDRDSDQARLDGIEEQLRLIEESNRKAGIAAVPLLQVWPLRTEQRELKKRISQNDVVMAVAKAQWASTNKMIKEFPEEPTVDMKALTGKAHAEGEAHKKLIEATELRIKALEIRAPIDGVISTLYYRPGATLKVGEPILTIAANEGQFILSYVRQGRNLEPQPQMVVDVRRRVIPREAGKGYIERIGSQVEQVPPNHCRDPRSMEWGLPVQIRIPPNLKLRPGEIVDLRLEPSEPFSQSFPEQHVEQRYAGVARPIAHPIDPKVERSQHR